MKEKDENLKEGWKKEEESPAGYIFSRRLAGESQIIDDEKCTWRKLWLKNIKLITINRAQKEYDRIKQMINRNEKNNSEIPKMEQASECGLKEDELILEWWIEKRSSYPGVE